MFTTTDKYGNYTFSVNSGTYTVSVETKLGWSIEAPMSPYTVTLAEGQIVGERQFSMVRGISTDPTNHPPTFASKLPGEITTPGRLRYRLNATDLDGDSLTYDLLVKPDGMVIDAEGTLVWRPTIDQVGSHDVIIRVQDGKGGSDIQVSKIVVNRANSAPAFAETPLSFTATNSVPFQYQFKAHDAEDDPITFSLETSIPNASIDAKTGVLNWTPSYLGLYSLVIVAADGRGGINKRTIGFQVSNDGPNTAPVFTSQPREVINVGQPYVYQVRVADAEHDALLYSIESIRSLSGTLEPLANLSIDAKTGLVSYQPLPTQVGKYEITLKVSDGRGGETRQAWALTVQSLPHVNNQAPTITSTPQKAATVGNLYHYDLQATDSEHDIVLWKLDDAPAGMTVDAELGTLRWVPSPEQLGECKVVVRAQDALGASVTQTFVVNVRAVNVPPNITSVPPTQAAVDKLYQYAVQATDTEQDSLIYSLLNPASGMSIDAQTGLVQWRPTTAQLGKQDITVSVNDGQGGTVTQIFNIIVGSVDQNLPPAIISKPLTAAAVGQPYQYQVSAQDPESSTLVYSLQIAPTGMMIDPQTGLIQWTPDSTQVGAALVKVVATDAQGSAAIQGFIVTAVQNHAPVLKAQPTTRTTVGQPYRFDVQAIDPDQDPLTYRLDQSPQGMKIDAQGRLVWTPTLADAGKSYPIVVTVQDNHGAAVQQTFTLSVVADTEAPNVEVFATQTQANLGSTITLIARATDNVGVANLTLMVEGQAVTLDASGRATVHLDHTGTLHAIATATDASGNQGQANTTIQVIDPTVTFNPVFNLNLSSLTSGTITAPTKIYGTVGGAGVDHYELAIAPLGSEDFKTIASGTSAITNGVLGTVDPSLLQNDSYTLRLSVFGQDGSATYTEDTVNVSGDLKLGNFRLSFTDLTVPVTGIPISLTRTYDTLTAGQSEEFGYGWRMEFRDTDLRTSLKRDPDLEALGFYPGFKDNTRVYITVPGGKREAFTFKPVLDPALAAIAKQGGFIPEALQFRNPAFEADKGVTSTLSVEQSTRLIRNSETGEYSVLGYAYNPSDRALGSAVYRLTTKEGVIYRIDANSGKLLTVQDPNGNTLTYTENAIISSTGQQVTFERDPQGRITTVKDPQGELIRYGYDASGDLVSVTDRENNTTRMVYDTSYDDPNYAGTDDAGRTKRSHFLREIIDPLGRTGARSEYDENGRLKQIVDVNGKAVEMTYDTGNSRQVVKDQLGYETTYIYDDRGNVVTEIDVGGDVLKRTYDNDNHLLTQTDPEGNTTSYAYDQKGNLTLVTDALGNKTYFTFNQFGEILTKTNSLGSTITYTYDDRGNRLSLTNAEGGTIKYSSNNLGRTTAIVGADGSTTQFQYDASGNLIRQTDALGHDAAYTYDQNGNQLSETTYVTLPTGVQALTKKWTYDADNRATSITDSNGNVTRQEYDKLGNLVAAVDPLGHRTEYAYDEKGKLVKTLYADGTSTRSVYDANGNEIASIDQAGNATHFTYDALGRLIDTIYPDVTPNDLSDNPTTHTQYDKAGRVVARIDERGNQTTYTYDAVGHQVAVRDALGDQTTYTYAYLNDLLTL